MEFVNFLQNGLVRLVTKDTYDLDVGPALRFHSCFHTSLLKPYQEDLSDTRINRPQEGVLLLDGSEGFIVKDILDLKKIRGVEVALVRWQGFSAADDTWEPVENLRQCVGLVDRCRDRLKTRNSSRRRSGKTNTQI